MHIGRHFPGGDLENPSETCTFPFVYTNIMGQDLKFPQNFRFFQVLPVTLSGDSHVSMPSVPRLPKLPAPAPDTLNTLRTLFAGFTTKRDLLCSAVCFISATSFWLRIFCLRLSSCALDGLSEYLSSSSGVQRFFACCLSTIIFDADFEGPRN